MALNFCVVSIHSCPGEKIGLNKAGGLNIYVTNLVNFLSTNHNVYLITKDCDNCDLNFLKSIQKDELEELLLSSYIFSLAAF